MLRTLTLILVVTVVLAGPALAKEKEGDTLFTLKNKDIDIRDALQMIARSAKINVVFSKDVRGKIAVELTDVPYMKAMEAIALTNKLVVHEYDKKSKIYLILRHDDAEAIVRYKMMKRRQAQRNKFRKRRSEWKRSRGGSGGGPGFWSPPAGGGGSGRANSWRYYEEEEEETEE